MDEKDSQAGVFFLLAVLFFGAAALFFRPYLIKDKETEQRELSLKVEKQVFEIGEDAGIEGLVFCVSRAELTEDYEAVDAWYKERGYITNPEDFVKTCAKEMGQFDVRGSSDMFPGDVRYFQIEYSVTNNSDREMDFSPERMSVNSIIEGQIVPLDFQAFDMRGISKDEEREIEFTGSGPKPFYLKKLEGETKQIYTLSPGETICMKAAGEFSVLSYQPYSSININDSYDLYLMNDTSSQRIHLNIAGSFGSGEHSYKETRNIQKMKYESWTNLERREWADEWLLKGIESSGYLELSRLRELGGLAEYLEPGHRTAEVISYNALYLETTLDNFWIAEWKDVPAVYDEQGNLKQMAARYQSVYGCREEELKVLLLDLTYVLNDMQETKDNTAVNDLYEKSHLYIKSRDKEKVKWFAQADDWTVLFNSKNPEETGPINIITMNSGDIVTAQMAYILPPAVFEQYDALYFAGNSLAGSSEGDIVGITEIALNK